MKKVSMFLSGFCLCALLHAIAPVLSDSFDPITAVLAGVGFLVWLWCGLRK